MWKVPIISGRIRAAAVLRQHGPGAQLLDLIVGLGTRTVKQFPRTLPARLAVAGLAPPATWSQAGDQRDADGCHLHPTDTQGIRIWNGLLLQDIPGGLLILCFG